MMLSTNLLRHALALLGSALLITGLMGCDAIGPVDTKEESDLATGRFEIVLSGAMQDTLRGLAAFGTTTVEDSTGEAHEIFNLTFMPDTALAADERPSAWFNAQILGATGQPGEGEYEFAQIDGNHFPDDPLFPDDIYAFSFQTEDTVRYAVVTSQEGQLEITSSSSAQLAGRFTVETTGAYYHYDSMETPRDTTITFEGSFNAVGGEVPDQF